MEWKDTLKKLGLMHLIVVSGSQVSLVVGMLYVGLNQGLSRRTKLMATYIICIGFYCLTGGGASIFRAITMAMIMITLKEMKLKTTPSYVLLITAGFMLLLNPNFIHQIGYLLSFAATSSLIYGVPLFETFLSKKPCPSFIVKPLALALAPFFFTFPILASAMQTISLTSIISNLLLVTYIEWLVVIGFFSTLLSLCIPIIAPPLFFICNIMLDIFLACVSSINILKIPEIYIQKPPIMLMCLPYFLIALLLTFPHSKRLKKIAVITVCSMLTSSAINASVPLPYTTVTFLDVGQGDACLIQTQNKKSILIDTGPGIIRTKSGKTFGTLQAKWVVLPALKNKGINKIDTLIITHFDADHAGGLEFLVNELNIGQIIHNGNFKNKRPNIFHHISSKQIPIIEPTNGRLELTQNTYIDFYSVKPLLTRWKKTITENNASLIMKFVNQDNTSVLFTGDLEASGEQAFINQFNNKAKADIYQVGHHGSNTSSTAKLLTYVQPNVSVISVGRKNRYKHPSPEVLNRLQRLPSHVRLTSKHGAIDFILKNGKIFAKSYRNISITPKL